MTRKNCSDSRFSITDLWVGSEAGVNDTVIFLAKETNMHPRIRVNNLVTKYGLPDGSCVIPEKAAYMDDNIWAKAEKVVAPGIRKMVVSNIDLV